ncbi:MAG: hypothetical protein ACR2IF_09270 [Terriglobales bacterium]
MRILRLSFVFSIAILVAAPAAAQSDDLAAVAAVTRATARTTHHVVTNDEIPAHPPEAKPAAAQSAGPAPSAPKADSDGASEASKPSGKPVDPDVATAIEQIRKQETALKEKLNRIKDKLANEDDDFRRQMWSDALENQKNTLEQFRKVREKLEQQGQTSDSQAQGSDKPPSSTPTS